MLLWTHSEGTFSKNHDFAETPEVVVSLCGALKSAHAMGADLFSRQREALSTVNIALFGRTGAGKSSLIEALSHGEGKTISTGECDFTVEIRPTNWRGIQFIDTPRNQRLGPHCEARRFGKPN